MRTCIHLQNALLFCTKLHWMIQIKFQISDYASNNFLFFLLVLIHFLMTKKYQKDVKSQHYWIIINIFRSNFKSIKNLYPYCVIISVLSRATAREYLYCILKTTRLEGRKLEFNADTCNFKIIGIKQKENFITSSVCVWYLLSIIAHFIFQRRIHHFQATINFVFFTNVLLA